MKRFLYGEDPILQFSGLILRLTSTNKSLIGYIFIDSIFYNVLRDVLFIYGATSTNLSYNCNTFNTTQIVISFLNMNVSQYG
jgi:hypothetical protein